MKIRIKGNTLRLRLTKTEVELFAHEGLVSDSIDFGENQLIYTLQSSPESTLKATFNGEFITVHVPKAQGKAWATSDEVGISEEMPINEGRVLSLLIEKDFQCLKPRPGEDERDMYSNPQA